MPRYVSIPLNMELKNKIIRYPTFLLFIRHSRKQGTATHLPPDEQAKEFTGKSQFWGDLGAWLETAQKSLILSKIHF